MSKSRMTSEPGYKNRNDQEVIRNTGKQGTDYLQYIYELCCRRCGHQYGSNGSDIHERRCPKCQGGKPGFDLE
jgi:predicted Zn-ribbon and HTH transcriptional regulator